MVVYEAWPPGHVAVADERREAVGGGVDGGREARRPGADDDEVVVLALRAAGDRPTLHATASTVAPVKALVAVDEDGKARIDQPEAVRASRSASAEPASCHSYGCAVRVRKSRRR